jgi:hypothetical protein
MKNWKIKIIGMFAFLLATGLLYAAEIEGVVTQRRYNEDDLDIFVDTDTNTPGAEYMIRVPNIYSSLAGQPHYKLSKILSKKSGCRKHRGVCGQEKTFVFHISPKVPGG